MIALRKEILLGWAWLPLVVVVFAPTFLWLWDRWTMSIWHNGHGIFIPFIVAFLVYDYLKRENAPPEESSRYGFFFLVPALLLVAIDSAIRTELLSAFALVLSVPGFFLLFLGARRTQALAFPLFLMLFMLPIPGAFVHQLLIYLRLVSAAGAEWIVAAVGVPVFRIHTTLQLPSTGLEIVDACSGFSTLYAASTVAVILAFFLTDLPRRILVLAAAAPLAILCNIVRCGVLALMVHYWGGDILDTVYHPMTGIVSFWGALMLLFFLSRIDLSRSST